MNFNDTMQIYFNLRVLDERKEKIRDVISQLETMQKMDDPIISLNLAESIMEYCLLIENDVERLIQYDRALELIQNTRRILREESQIKQLLRSYHLECFIKFHTMKYKDVDASIQDISDLGECIIKKVVQTRKFDPDDVYKEYHSLGCVWHAYGLVLQLIHKTKELELSKRLDVLENARELVHKAVQLGHTTNNRDVHILSAYMFAFVDYLPQIASRGDKATTEEDYLRFMHPYEILYEIAHTYGSIEFEYLALLNHVRLNLERVAYAVGTSEGKRDIFNEILDDFKKLEEYENIIHLPHLHFYRYYLQTDVYTSIVYFEVVQEEDFNYYMDEALKFAEKMKTIYQSAKMKSARDKVQMYHALIFLYMMKASFTTSRQDKLEFLTRSEELLLEDVKISATWSTKVYSTWRDLSSVFLDLSKLERNQRYFKKCVHYAKKVYDSALKTEDFIDALAEAYKIAMVAEDYQEYAISTEYYEAARHLIDEIIQAGKEYPYYHDLKIYLQARFFGVKAKEEHRKGNYAQAMNLYRRASSILQSHDLYSYESVLFDVYSLFEEAAIYFIEEKYTATLKILSHITNLFDDTEKRHAKVYDPQFQTFMDRRAYDLQQLFFESSKTFCIAQSSILQSLIYRNTGDSDKAIKLLKEANVVLSEFTDRDIRIAGYYSFANGLFGLEQSELAIRDSDYTSAAAYLASASDQFENAAQVLASDERLKQLCEGLKTFCQGWMYASEIIRRGIDLNSTELNKNFALAHKSFENAIKDLKMFTKTSSGVSGFEKLLSYFYYSLSFQKTDDAIEKNKFKDKMLLALEEALQYFKDAEDMERYRFTRDLLATLPQLEDVRENVFKPISIPFTPYTPVFETAINVDPGGVHFVVSLDRDQVEVDERIKYTIQISSDASVHIKQIDGVFPKKDVKVISGMRLAKNGTVKINRLLSPGQSTLIEFTILPNKPFYSRKHPQLVYLNTKSEKFRTFAKPFSVQVYPKGVLQTGRVSAVNENVNLVKNIMDGLGIAVGEFPIIYHNLKSYQETLSEFFIYGDTKKNKKRRSKEVSVSQTPIKQMAFVDPLGDVNILYDLNKFIYPRSIVSILSIIIHEKFGHSFFFQHTTLGKKLLELEYHRKGISLLMKELEKISNKYAIGIQWLCMSTLIPNEGFAIWLTLKTFEKLFEEISEKDQQFAQQINHEIESIKERVFASNNLNVTHDYFALKYGLPAVNPYELGYKLFLQIEEKYGEQCVPKALELAADISLTKRQISRMPNTIKNDKNCADKRLEKMAKTNFVIERNDVKMFEDAVKKLSK